MAEIIDIRTCDDPRDVIHRLVERLAAGELVGLPTESAYVVAAQATQLAAVRRLRDRSDGPLSLSVRSVDEALDFAPSVDAIGERLIRRLWPGPVIVEAPGEGDEGLAAAFPPAERAAFRREGHTRLAMPDHDVPSAVQRLTSAPLALLTEPEGGVVTSPNALLERFKSALGVVIDDGPSLQPGRRTVVRVGGGRWEVVGPGLLDEAMIRERMSLGIVFVCTGNTCRSPLAEAIFRKLLAERLSCSESDLPGLGYFVTSAGLAAGYGMPAAAESLALAEEFGLNLASHSSRPLTDVLLDRADYVVTMTAGHRDSILAARPDLSDRVHLLSREGLDIADPIGGGPAEYEHCRAEIERELLVLIEHLPIGSKRPGRPDTGD